VGTGAMIHSGEGAEVDLWTQVPLTRVIEMLKYWGCRDRAKDFGRVFGEEEQQVE
jgi:hypothetical protein